MVKLFNLFYTTILPHYENFIHFVIQGNSVKLGAKVIWGITQNEKYKNKIEITLLATGCQEKECQNEKEKPLKKAKIF